MYARLWGGHMNRFDVSVQNKVIIDRVVEDLINGKRVGILYALNLFIFEDNPKVLKYTSNLSLRKLRRTIVETILKNLKSRLEVDERYEVYYISRDVYLLKGSKGTRWIFGLVKKFRGFDLINYYTLRRCDLEISNEGELKMVWV